MNRRQFVQSLFAGAMLIGSLSAPVIYHAHEHYTALPGVWNIWYVHDEFWYLLSDFNQAPLEFASEAEAKKYIEKSGLKEYRDEYRNTIISKEGMVYVRKAPTEIHGMEILRQDYLTIEEFLRRNGVEDSVQRDLIFAMLKADNAAEQCRYWIANLCVQENKKRILGLQACSEFGDILRSIYCTHNSYHTTLAKLEAFKPPFTNERLSLLPYEIRVG